MDTATGELYLEPTSEQDTGREWKNPFRLVTDDDTDPGQEDPDQEDTDQ